MIAILCMLYDKIYLPLVCPHYLSDKQQLINELAEKEPLTISHIEELSPHSSQYIIPYNQKRSKRYGLIIYSTHNRPGAQEEADNMERSLLTAGFDVKKMECKTALELIAKLESTLRRIAIGKQT